MLVCKGFANDAVLATSRELGVNIIEMSEYYLLLEPEELETIVNKAMRDVLEEYDLRPIPLEPPSEEDIKVLAALVASSSSEQAASNLGVSERELGGG
jgi:predicted RecB family endonuclease